MQNSNISTTKWAKGLPPRIVGLRERTVICGTTFNWNEWHLQRSTHPAGIRFGSLAHECKHGCGDVESACYRRKSRGHERDYLFARVYGFVRECVIARHELCAHWIVVYYLFAHRCRCAAPRPTVVRTTKSFKRDRFPPKSPNKRKPHGRYVRIILSRHRDTERSPTRSTQPFNPLRERSVTPPPTSCGRSSTKELMSGQYRNTPEDAFLQQWTRSQPRASVASSSHVKVPSIVNARATVPSPSYLLLSKSEVFQKYQSGWTEFGKRRVKMSTSISS